MRKPIKTDILVIGAGIAGAATAITAAEKGCSVILLTREKLDIEDSSTVRAQGGIVYKGKKDSGKKLADDIMEAGAGRCSPEAVKYLSNIGPNLVKKFLVDKLQIPFDKDSNGNLYLTQEGAHGISRIIHCKDITGRHISEGLYSAVKKNPGIKVMQNSTAIDILTTSHHSQNKTDVYKPITCVGAYVLNNKTKKIKEILAKETVLATGGLGQVYLHTTNGSSARGDGYAMALRASARVANMEFVQFHPTTLFGSSSPNFLITEALRGEGAVLRDETGRKFAKKYHPLGSLAPRDIVARAINSEMLKRHQPCMYLDISHKPSEWIKERFPTIYQTCLEHKIDITSMPIPVVPSAHYSCGGIMVDKAGKTSIPRLRAVGEVSCTGVHGANRLASVSLLEALVWGIESGKDMAKKIRSKKKFYFPPVSAWKEKKEKVDPALIEQDWMSIKHTMWNYVGLVRSDRRLRRAQIILRELQTEVELFYRKAEMSDEVIGLRNGLQTARSILYAAIRNPESCGCHYKT